MFHIVFYISFVLCGFGFLVDLSAAAASHDVLVFTVATEENDGYLRYLDSARRYNIEPRILGWGEKWRGGEITTGPGGGWKINLLLNALKSFENDSEKIVIFTDSYDVIFLGKLDEIVRRFKATNASILFGAEGFCWPKVELAQEYPDVNVGKRFLNSGIYMGYLSSILNLLNKEVISDEDDDQLYFTRAYLDKEYRESNKILLDHRSEIFQNINSAQNDLEVATTEYKDAGAETYSLKNTATHTEPLILHGNGPSKITLNYLSNYLPNGVWNSVEGCVRCKDGMIDLSAIDTSKWPVVYVAYFLEQNTPFLESSLEKIVKLEYPKNKMHIFIHNSIKYHNTHIEKFVKNHVSDYISLKEIKPQDGTPEWAARDLSIDQCLAKNCDFYLSVDSLAQLDNPYALKLLIEQNRTVVAPLLARPGKAWSNFWGAISKDGYYARSNDYMDIVHNEKRGLWSVPFINTAYLVNATLLRKYDRSKLSYDKPNVDADMAFCANLRQLGVLLYVSNRVDFGHLINSDSYDITRAEPDMYQIFDNEIDWEENYIHPDYHEEFKPEKESLQPCPDVYWFPIVTRKFTNALVNMMESFGKWSSGTNEDKRLEGGYEAVPTRDIHMNQVGWERHWLHFLHKYVRPLQEHVFLGYFHDPPKSLMNFVVRYRPDEQPLLRPHHDSSTYTINLALNQRGLDYEGGGCRFIRYNCSVTDTKPGWMLMHPGRLTHYHEGLRVTNGTRYIMVSFIDP